MAKVSAIKRYNDYAHFLTLSRDRLIFEGKQRGIDVEGMDQAQGIQAIMDYDDRNRQ
jgi:hypothetical protein